MVAIRAHITYISVASVKGHVNYLLFSLGNFGSSYRFRETIGETEKVTIQVKGCDHHMLSGFYEIKQEVTCMLKHINAKSRYNLMGWR